MERAARVVTRINPSSLNISSVYGFSSARGTAAPAAGRGTQFIKFERVYFTRCPVTRYTNQRTDFDLPGTARLIFDSRECFITPARSLRSAASPSIVAITPRCSWQGGLKAAGDKQKTKHSIAPNRSSSRRTPRDRDFVKPTVGERRATLDVLLDGPRNYTLRLTRRASNYLDPRGQANCTREIILSAPPARMS